jgi:hypothetical protein
MTPPWYGGDPGSDSQLWLCGNARERGGAGVDRPKRKVSGTGRTQIATSYERANG